MKRVFIIGLIMWSVGVKAEVSKYYYQGRMEIVDGDTLKTSQFKIRLAGVDTPELKQTCNDGKSQCGVMAKNKLIEFVNDDEIGCEKVGTDVYGRILGECYVRGENINRWLLLNGWAVYYSTNLIDRVAYKGDEITARLSKAGIWNMKFETPKIYRKNKKKLARRKK